MDSILYLLFVLISAHRVLQLANSSFECIYSDRIELLTFTQTAQLRPKPGLDTRASSPD